MAVLLTQVISVVFLAGVPAWLVAEEFLRRNPRA
jgi:hypothetical protein